MAARSKKPTRDQPEAVNADAVVAAYEAWLARQPLAGRSRDAYLAQVRGFVGWLAVSEHGGGALTEPSVRDWAVRDYKRHVKTAKRWAPTSVNQALAAIDNFYRSLGIGRPEVAREDLAQVAPGPWPKTSSGGSCGRWRVARRLGIGPLPRSSSIPVCVCPSLRPSRWRICRSQLAGVGCGSAPAKGDAYREVPLNSACRSALDEWTKARTSQLAVLAETDKVPAVPEALWLSRAGSAMSARAVDLIIRRLPVAGFVIGL